MARRIKAWKSSRGAQKTNRNHGSSRVMQVMKALLAAYVVTGLFLAALALLLYKTELNEQIVSASVTGIYLAATLIGGLIVGKQMHTRRFLWGLLLGMLYFSLLMLITLGVYRTLNASARDLITSMLVCMGGGTLGGMIA